MRLIDADALLKELKKSCEYHAENSRELSLLQRDIIIVQEQPTVDAVPVRHGKWIIGTVPYFVCSECKNRTPLRWDERRGYVLDYRSPYCPNCGAKMDEERKEE